MYNNKYWIGIRKSEIEYDNNFFKDSIVVFGKKDDNTIKSLNYSLKKNLDHNDAKNDEVITNYQKQYINSILSNDSNAEFMFYNQIMALRYFSDFPNIVCLNKKDLIDELEDKIYTREYYKNMIPTLPHLILNGLDVSIQNLQNQFKNANAFVVQSKTGSGGSGTLVYNSDTQNNLINKDDNYLVTKYYTESISINIHLMISKNEVYVFPGSIQIIENQYNHLVYKGCDFKGFQRIKSELLKKSEQYSRIIGADLQKRGYLGVCGIDFLICNDEVYLMEINSRFQNSSTVLNKALRENNMCSLQEMNYMCFNDLQINYQTIEVNYSSYIMDYEEESNYSFKYKPIEILDEPDIDMDFEKLSYWKLLIYDKEIFEGERYGIMEDKK